MIKRFLTLSITLLASLVGAMNVVGQTWNFSVGKLAGFQSSYATDYSNISTDITNTTGWELVNSTDGRFKIKATLSEEQQLTANSAVLDITKGLYFTTTSAELRLDVVNSCLYLKNTTLTLKNLKKGQYVELETKATSNGEANLAYNFAVPDELEETEGFGAHAASTAQTNRGKVKANGDISFSLNASGAAIQCLSIAVYASDGETVLTKEQVLNPNNEEVTAPSLSFVSATNTVTITAGESSYSNLVTTYYTIDGSDPSDSENASRQSFTDDSKSVVITEDATIRAISVSSASISSTESTENYTYYVPTPVYGTYDFKTWAMNDSHISSSGQSVGIELSEGVMTGTFTGDNVGTDPTMTLNGAFSLTGTKASTVVIRRNNATTSGLWMAKGSGNVATLTLNGLKAGDWFKISCNEGAATFASTNVYQLGTDPTGSVAVDDALTSDVVYVVKSGTSVDLSFGMGNSGNAYIFSIQLSEDELLPKPVISFDENTKQATITTYSSTKGNTPSIYFTTSDDDMTEYDGSAIAVTNPITIKAQGRYETLVSETAELEVAGYTISAPTISANGAEVTITAGDRSDENEEITTYYTLDNTDPTASESRLPYSAPFTLEKTAIVRAYSYYNNFTTVISDEAEPLKVRVGTFEAETNVYDFEAAAGDFQELSYSSTVKTPKFKYYYNDTQNSNEGNFYQIENTDYLTSTDNTSKVYWREKAGNLTQSGGITSGTGQKYFVVDGLSEGKRVVVDFTGGKLKYATGVDEGEATVNGTTLSRNTELTSGATITISSGEYIVLNVEAATVVKKISVLDALPTYTLTFAEPKNGTLTIKNGEDEVESGATFYNGTVLDITATANDGYELDALTINGTAIDAADITENPAGTYTYSLSMPAEATTVAVTFKAEAIVKSESVVYDFAAAEEITSANTSGHSRNLTYVDQNSETQNNKGFRYQMENENHLRLLTYSSTGKFTQGTGVWLDGSNRPFAIEGLKKGDVIRIIHNGTVKNATLTDNGTTITDIEGNEFSDVIASGKEIKVSAASSTNDYAVFMAASSGLVISQIAINKGLKPRVVYDSYDEGTSTFTYNVSFYEGEVLHYKVDDGDETTVEYTTENNGTVSVAVGTGNLICWTTYDEVASDEVTTKVALPQVPVAEKTTDGTTSQVYTITFNEGETLHYTISYQSAEQTVEYTVENQGKVEVTVVGNGYIEFWTTIGSLTSEKGQQVIEGIHIEDDANTGKDDDAYNFKTWSSNVTTTGDNTNYYSLSLDKSEAVANVGEKDLYLLTNLYDNNVMMDLHGAFALSDEGVNSNERTIINIRKSYGLHTESSKTAYLSILNLKAGDNIKMVLNNDNDVSLLSTNAHLKGTGITPAADGSTVWGKENTWVMDADGRLDLKFGSGSGQSYIQSITITSHETVTAGAITVDEANPNKITISQGTTDVEGNTVTTYYSLDGSEPTTELTENLEQELTASATIRTMTKSSTGKTASYIYSFVYQQPSASVAIDFQDAAEAGEELAFETAPTNVWEYASSTSPNQARTDYYLLTNNSETLPIDGKISWRDPKDSKPTLESTGIKGNGYPFAIHDLAKNDEVIIVYSGTLTNATSTSGNSFSIDDTTVEAEANIPSGSTMKITSIGDHNTIVLKPGSNTVISAVYINHEVVVKLEKVSAPTVELRSGFTNRITITPGVSSYGSTVTTYYTTDGTTPTTESTPITGKTNIGPFTESITVKAYTVSETGVESSVSTFELVPPTFSVNLPTESEGGSVTADKTEAAEGETVRLTITLAEGYHLALLKVDNGAEVGTNNSFKMPASEVNITATFESDAESDPSEEVRENVTVIDEDNAKVTSVVIGSEATTVTISGSVDGVPVTSISNDVFTAANTEDVAAIDLSETAITLTGVRSEIAALQNISESTLVYLPSTANVTGTNVVKKSVDDDTYICEDYQMTDGKEVAIPHEFTATEATMNRTFTANKKCTVCLPYAFKATGGTFYKFTGINNGKVQMTAQEDGSVLEANTPYIFEPSEGTTAIISQNVEVSIIDAPQTENSDAHFTFKGTYEKLVWESPVGIYGFAAQQQGMTEIGQFVRVGSGASIEACRAFLQYTGEDTLNGAESRRSNIILPNVMEIEWIKAGSQNTTAIDSMKSSVDNDDIPVYNMKGQRVDNSYKGLVIKNGKKVVKK